jgi:hypothetical protein
MPPFKFHPELFEHRTLASEALAAEDYLWLSDYASIDLRHEDFGLEVCAIKDEADAIYIQCILRALFPDWPFSRRCLKDYGDRDLGWRVTICREEQERGDSRQEI